MKVGEKSSLAFGGERGKEVILKYAQTILFLLTMTCSQEKLFYQILTHMDFYQSLTNVEEGKYQSPSPSSLPVLLSERKKAEKHS